MSKHQTQTETAATVRSKDLLGHDHDAQHFNIEKCSYLKPILEEYKWNIRNRPNLKLIFKDAV